jgi:hypothetical protein
MSIPVVILVVGVIGAQHADASNTLARCSNRSLQVVLPRTEGTATQAVAFLSILNRGVACRLIATASLTVVRHGARVVSIRGNPVSYRINQTIAHGATMLFDAWWSNWCGSRSDAFRVRGVIGALTASGPYNVLPECLGARASSRLASG